MNRALPVLAALLFVLWFAGQFASRSARPPERAQAPAAALPAGGTLETRLAGNATREILVRTVAPPRPVAVVTALTLVEELLIAGRVEDAMGKLQELLAADTPAEVRAASLSELARLHMVRRDFQGARALFEKLLKEFPGHPNAGNAQRAIEYMERFETFKASFLPIEGELR